MVATMATAPTALPPEVRGDTDALEALLAAERTAHAAVIAERVAIVTERNRLADRTATLEASNATLEVTNTKLQDTNTRLELANARLEQILAEIRRAHFGRKSERIDDNQLALALEELETAAAKIEAEVGKAKPASARSRRQRQTNNSSLDHLPHEEVVIEPEGGTPCPCCQGALHRIGEDTVKRLDVVLGVGTGFHPPRPPNRTGGFPA